MRWKEFMAYSLPRSWTKARRRNSIPKILKNNKNNEEHENAENNNDIQNWENSKFPVGSIDNNMRYEQKCMCVKEIPIVPRSSIIPRRNRNLSTYNSLPKTNPYTQNSPEFRVASDEERNDNETLPRTRSRIKTNPWLPSPKITPASLTINFSASNSSLLSSPNGSRSSSMDRSLGSMGSRSSSLYSRSRSLGSPKDFGSPRDFDALDLAKLDDDCGSGSGKLSSGIGLASDGEGTSISSMESEGFVFYESMDDLHTSPIIRHRNRRSFNYEDQFETMVESFHEKTQNSVTSLDLLHVDQSVTELAPPPRRNPARLNVGEDPQDEEDDGIGHSDDENVHMYVNLSYEHKVSKRKQKPKVNPKPEIRLSLDSTASNDTDMIDIDEKAQVMTLAEENKATVKKRSIDQVRAQLEAKIHQLRQDKYLVEEKIRAAQEEEKVREKLRQQKEVTLRRKELMVRTLTDIRYRLEGQCQRLQSAYPSVLQLQTREKHQSLAD